MGWPDTWGCTVPNAKNKVKVSPNNPCPFLRALVQQGLLSNDVAVLGDVASAIVKVAKAGEGSPKVPGPAIQAIGLIANGLGPTAIARNAVRGVKLNALRNGPLDKKGVGSRILNARGVVSPAQLERLTEFASDKVAADGTVEPGLDAADLKRMMDANFARAEGHRRAIDRALMDGEWPILLKVMGKRGKAGRYLSLADVRTLFVDRAFPARMMSKLAHR
jgi:hypothetical protein